MNKYKVTHKANAQEVWRVQEIEADWVQANQAGDLSIGVKTPKTSNIIAAGWWMSVERIDPPAHGEPGHGCQDGCPVD
jgi:hypothetical protein